MAENARIVIEADRDGRVCWELVDQSGYVRVRRDGPFASVDEARADVETYRRENPEWRDAEIVTHGTVPNV